ncbi:hypothetical protein [Aequorivita sinensis]|uniref:hypothetical protein n=1 Tax=Aequorivita sinensis TaxID=1382458 RepID=UPI001121CAC9|nr:hypothetical protein [Aequorivita sinensis]
MTKRILILIPIILVVIGLIYFNLPFEITRKSDINLGNILAGKIEQFKKKNNELPNTDDWKVLEELGFKTEMLGTDPTYQKINDNEFELIFLEGFDGPYLLYNSKSDNWSMDFPKPPQKFKLQDKSEENYPWSKEVTEAAIDAILFSIENNKKAENERNPNFPSNPNNVPFTLTDSTEFEIAGYSTIDEEKETYWISFKRKSEMLMSGPSIIVEINIKTAKAIQVYMNADA